MGTLCWDLFVLHLICFIFIYTVLLIIISLHYFYSILESGTGGGLGWVYVRGCGVEFGWGLVEWGSVSVGASGWLVL